MTTFTVVTICRETFHDAGDPADYEERDVILRSRESLHGSKFGTFGRWYSRQVGMGPNSWSIVNISEYPDRHTFEHLTGGF